MELERRSRRIFTTTPFLRRALLPKRRLEHLLNSQGKMSIRYFLNHFIIVRITSIQKFSRCNMQIRLSQKQHYCSSCNTDIEAEKGKLSKNKSYNEEVVAKYKNIFEHMAPPADKETGERYYRTNFGTISFDDDNPANVYYDGPRTRKRQQEKGNLQNNKSQQEHLNYVDKYYFEDSLNSSRFEADKEDSEDWKPAEEVQKDDVADVNFIDSQYINNSVQKDEKERSYEYTSSTEFSDVNFVDDQCFNKNSSLETPISYVALSQVIVDDCENAGNLSVDDSYEISTYSDSYPQVANICIPQKLKILENSAIKREKSELFSFENAILEESGCSLDNSERSELYDLQIDRTERIQWENRLIALSEAVNISNKSNSKSVSENKHKESEQKHSVNIEAQKAVPHTESAKVDSMDDRTASHSDPMGVNGPQNAYQFVLKKRKEEATSNQETTEPPLKQYQKIIGQVPVYHNFLKYDFIKMLKNNVLYNDNDIIAIFKPYGIKVQGGASNKYEQAIPYNIVDSLPDLARAIKVEQILPVHRLDINTTGVLLFARTTEMADRLKKLFKEQKIKKTYLTITKGIPSPLHGIINMPIAEGRIENHIRMVLKPDIDGFRGKSGTSRQAITKYNVISRANSSALVMLNPITGVKHQLRVHLGFGLACPVLGDHKYSHLKKMMPQKLPGDMLDHLEVKQTRVRDLPSFLHAFSVSIPFILDNRDIFIKVGPPQFFKTAMKCLELNKIKNHTDKAPELMFDE